MALMHSLDVVDRLRHLEMLSSEQSKELAREAARCDSPDQVAEFLSNRGWLTPLQLEYLRADRLDHLQLGGYRLLEKIGEGGMGEVYRALQLKLNRVVAIKLIRRDLSGRQDLALQRFRREALAVARLAHPNIIVIFDADEYNDTHYIAMEFIPGVDLGQMVRDRGPLPIEVACDYLKQAALGLQHIFENGLVHRDIKPSNLLVALPDPARSDSTGEYPNGIVKILDLGLVTAVTDDETDVMLSRVSGVMGTPDYIAPEQAHSSKLADIRSDLYSLGCTFYYLVTGRAPFSEGTEIEKILHHELDAPTPIDQLRPGVPSDLVEMVGRLLAKKPEDRFQTPAELVRFLGRPKGIEPLRPSAILDLTRGATGPPTSPTLMVTALPTRSPKPVPFEHTLIPEHALQPVKAVASTSPLRGPLPVVSLAGLPELAPLSPSAFGPAIKAAEIQAKSASKLALLNGPSAPTAGPRQATRVASLDAHSSTITQLAYSRCGRYLATAGLDQSVRVWELVCGTYRRVANFTDELLGEVHHLKFSVDGCTLFVAGNGFGGRIWRWSWTDESDGEMHGLKGAGLAALAISPDGKWVAAAGPGGEANSMSVWSLEKGGPVAFGRLSRVGAEIQAAVFAPDGNSLICGTSEGAVHVWKSGWRKFRSHVSFEAHAGAITSMAIAPARPILATTGTDNLIRIWSVEGKPTLMATVKTGDRGVTQNLQFGTAREGLLSVSSSGQVALWRDSDFSLETEWNVNQQMFSSQEVAHHGLSVGIGRTDGVVELYDIGSSSSGSSVPKWIPSAGPLPQSKLQAIPSRPRPI